MADERLNLNTATAIALQALPGVGAAAAQRIIDYRNAWGGQAFKKIEDLMNVKGFGERVFLKLKPLIAVAEAAPLDPTTTTADTAKRTVKVRVQWEYTYSTTCVFDQVVEVVIEDDDPDDPATDDDVRAWAWEGAQALPNGDLPVVETRHDGDPLDDMISAEIVAPETPATIRYQDGDDPEWIGPTPEAK